MGCSSSASHGDNAASPALSPQETIKKEVTPGVQGVKPLLLEFYQKWNTTPPQLNAFVIRVEAGVEGDGNRLFGNLEDALKKSTSGGVVVLAPGVHLADNVIDIEHTITLVGEAVSFAYTDKILSTSLGLSRCLVKRKGSNRKETNTLWIRPTCVARGRRRHGSVWNRICGSRV